MVLKSQNLKAIVAATLLTVTFFSPFTANAQDSTDESALLEALAEADSAAALALDRQLQALWGNSGSAAMDLLLKRSLDAIERGDMKQAVEHLTALTDHAPNFAYGWYQRARVYYLIERYGPAVADLERALFLNPNDYNAIFALGNVFEHFRDPERAYQSYLRAQAIHPHHGDVTSALERLKPAIVGKEL
ncbi:tetratricopeptide repeat protein [Parasedimentitalea huanghaiensis]|uniref:Tetratricopeptide repeat protein n=1 Tax=Parasedimentitalea huanghaiensis TaxID=2682100 RepID=A0A6L6WJP6_9RHOB|nr:tetratricopeptide repeat protein [Zongyanglinia huanghaiensis]MVO16287.1 tetratricopeptide repeat protein [Zongyanglinia huanghaiensis]